MSMKAAVNAMLLEATANQQDVRVLLKKDHEEALGLAKEMHTTASGSRRRAIFAKLHPALVAHSRSEEKNVYESLLALRKSKAAEAHDISQEGYVEHSLLDTLLKRLAADLAEAGKDPWKAEAKVLFEVLDHHIQDEHGTMFSELGKQFSSAQLVQMGDKFARGKAQILAKEKKSR